MKFDIICKLKQPKYKRIMNQNQQVIDEHLLLQYLNGNADEALRASVGAWLDADSGNREHLDRLESLWVETGRISPTPVAVDIEAAWMKMSARLNVADGIPAPEAAKEKDRLLRTEGKTIRMRYTRYLFRAAAMIVLLVGLYSLYWQFLRPVNQIVLASNEVVMSDTLPDGTKITLNRDSKLVYPEKFDRKKRTVNLTGEAFFEVKHNAAQPFIIDAGPAGIRVLGTSFRVKTRSTVSQQGGAAALGWGDPARVAEVTVSEGSVMLFSVDGKSGDTASVILAAGETGILESGSGRPVRIGNADSDNLFWANRSLDFRGTPISAVIKILQQYYPVTITVSDRSILECRLTASFADDTIDGILTVIAGSFGLKLEVQGQNYQLKGNGCSNQDN